MTHFSLEEIKNILLKNTAVLLYFSSNSCNVAEALAPKVVHMLKTNFPEVKFYNIAVPFFPEISAYYNVFVAPTILVFFEGKENIRRSRIISVNELQNSLKKPVQLIFK